MNKRGAATLFVIFIVGVVFAGGYFGYKTLDKKEERENFGLGLWNCSTSTFEIGPRPPLGYGRANVTGAEKHDLKHTEEMKLCCMDFVVDETEEKYKICAKRDSNGTATHKVVWQNEERLYEIVPWQNLSCLYDYRNQEDWIRTCEEDSNLLFSSPVEDSNQSKDEDDSEKNDSYYFEKALEGGTGASCGYIDNNSLRDNCYLTLACNKTKDFVLCEILENKSNDQEKIDSCYYCVATSTGSKSFCDRISNSSLREKCIGFDSGNVFKISDLECGTNKSSFKLTLNLDTKVSIYSVGIIKDFSDGLGVKIPDSEWEEKRVFSKEGETKEYSFDYEGTFEEGTTPEKIEIGFEKGGDRYGIDFYC